MTVITSFSSRFHEPVDQRLTVPVTMAEFAVVRVLLQYAIPHMLMDVMLNPSLISFDSSSQQLEAQQHFTSQPGAGAGARGRGRGLCAAGMGGGGGGGIEGLQEGPGAAGGIGRSKRLRVQVTRESVLDANNVRGIGLPAFCLCIFISHFTISLHTTYTLHVAHPFQFHFPHSHTYKYK